MTLHEMIVLGLFIFAHTGALIWKLSQIESALKSLTKAVADLEHKVYTDHAKQFAKLEHRVTTLEAKS